MPKFEVHRPKRRSRGRLWVTIIFFAVLISPILALIATMEATPAVSQRAPANADDVARAKLLYRRLAAFKITESREEPIEFTVGDLNSLSALATRAFPAVRGEAAVESGALKLTVAVKIPAIPLERWLNFRSVVQPSGSGLNLSSVRLGQWALPPTLVLTAVRSALDVVLGDGLGSKAVGGIRAVAIDQGRVAVWLSLGAKDRKMAVRQVKEVMWRLVWVNNEADVRRYVLALDAAAKDGKLDPGGSLVPYLKFAVSQALRNARPDSGLAEMQSAITALAIYCGHVRFQEVVGNVIPPAMRNKLTGCAKVTLDGRQDLRQHFVISAGLEAFSDSQAAFALGEFKELLDANPGGSGFSFDDLAADQTGIRFADALLSSEPPQWQTLINRLTVEADIFPSITSLPSGLQTTEFKQHYGDIDSAPYKALLAEIHRRIDALKFFRHDNREHWDQSKP